MNQESLPAQHHVFPLDLDPLRNKNHDVEGREVGMPFKVGVDINELHTELNSAPKRRAEAERASAEAHKTRAEGDLTHGESVITLAEALTKIGSPELARRLLEAEAERQLDRAATRVERPTSSTEGGPVMTANANGERSAITTLVHACGRALNRLFVGLLLFLCYVIGVPLITLFFAACVNLSLSGFLLPSLPEALQSPSFAHSYPSLYRAEVVACWITAVVWFVVIGLAFYSLWKHIVRLLEPWSVLIGRLAVAWDVARWR